MGDTATGTRPGAQAVLGPDARVSRGRRTHLPGATVPGRGGRLVGCIFLQTRFETEAKPIIPGVTT